MFLKFVIIFGICLLTINMSNGLTQKELCDFQGGFIVQIAFKFREFICIGGLAIRNMKAPTTLAIRVKHWHSVGSSNVSKKEFYEAKVWTDIEKITKKKYISMAFNTRGVRVFPKQKDNELVFLIQVCPELHFNYH